MGAGVRVETLDKRGVMDNRYGKQLTRLQAENERLRALRDVVYGWLDGRCDDVSLRRTAVWCQEIEGMLSLRAAEAAGGDDAN